MGEVRGGSIWWLQHLWWGTLGLSRDNSHASNPLPIQALAGRVGGGWQTASVRTQSFYLKKKKKTVNSHSGQQLEMDLKKMTGKEPVIRKSVERPAHKREGWGEAQKREG